MHLTVNIPQPPQWAINYALTIIRHRSIDHEERPMRRMIQVIGLTAYFTITFLGLVLDTFGRIAG